MTEKRRDDMKVNDASEDIHQILLVDQTNDKSNTGGKGSSSKNNLDKSIRPNELSKEKLNQKSKFNLNDRLIMVFLLIIGLIFVTTIILTIILFLHCRSETNHLRKLITSQNNSKMPDQMLPTGNTDEDNQNKSGRITTGGRRTIGRSRSGDSNHPESFSD